AASVDAACGMAEKDGIRGHVMIDASHANSGKDPMKQPAVLADVAAQIAGGDQRVTGVMIESHLVEGRQDLGKGELTYGQSITDGCLGWEETAAELEKLAAAVKARRAAASPAKPERGLADA
ncbi:MAG: 3-deoxy-7-phosphoheptulonate synthase, partial [Leisingera sp.]